MVFTTRSGRPPAHVSPLQDASGLCEQQTVLLRRRRRRRLEKRKFIAVTSVSRLSNHLRGNDFLFYIPRRLNETATDGYACARARQLMPGCVQCLWFLIRFSFPFDLVGPDEIEQRHVRLVKIPIISPSSI